MEYLHVRYFVIIINPGDNIYMFLNVLRSKNNTLKVPLRAAT